MIQSVKIRNFRNSTFLQFLSNVHDLVLENDPVALKVKNPFEQLSGHLKKATELFKKDSSNLSSEELFSLDTERDNLFNGIRFSVEAALLHPDKNLQKHARVLEISINLYGKGIPSLSYQSETAVLKTLLEDWSQKPELSQAITALGLEPWVKRLEEVNTEFDQKYMVRAKQSGDAPQKPFREARGETMAAYYKLRDYLNSLYVLNEGADPYGKLNNRLNAIIDYYNNVLRQGKTNDTPPAPDASQGTGVN